MTVELPWSDIIGMFVRNTQELKREDRARIKIWPVVGGTNQQNKIHYTAIHRQATWYKKAAKQPTQLPMFIYRTCFASRTANPQAIQLAR